MASEHEKELQEIISKVLEYSPKADTKLIKKAFEFTNQVNQERKLKSGEDYIVHPLHVVKILIDLKVDSPTIAAGFLHGTLEKRISTEQQLKKEFGSEVTELIKGVTKMDRIQFKTLEEYNAENIRKIVLAMAKDVRVILIKLADRLEKMRNLHLKPEKERLLISQETLEIFAPIAYKLGIYRLKSDLEDSALKFINPKIYSEIKKRIAKKRGERDKEAIKITEYIQNLMDKNKIKCKVFGRAKHFYSIYKKMINRKRKFNEIYDLLAFRVITTNMEDCYSALGIIHSTWRHIPSEFSDHIANPKHNGYQSIHTKVILDNNPIEIQIRTIDMHKIAEEGIAAHWRYKGTEHDKKFDRKIAWLKQILTWKREAKSAEDFIESLKIDLFKNQIVVLTPKGDPITLPEGSTPIDFAYSLHSGIGNSCDKAQVNSHIVPLDYELKPGDVVEITTSRKAKPSRNWLRFSKTAFARSKIRVKLGIKGILKDKAPPKTKFSKEEKETILHINATDRVGILAQILNTIAEENLGVLSINADSKKKHNQITIKVNSEDPEKIERVLINIKRITGIIQVNQSKE